MNSSRPYLVRALYEWIVDNNCTPHLLVNAEHAGVQVPAGYANDGQIVLNVSPSAVRHLHMDNEAVSFEGRFGGVAHTLHSCAGDHGHLCAGERAGHGLRSGAAGGGRRGPGARG